MKTIQKFREHEAIPDNAKFLFKEDSHDDHDNTIPIYVYEVPLIDTGNNTDYASSKVHSRPEPNTNPPTKRVKSENIAGYQPDHSSLIPPQGSSRACCDDALYDEHHNILGRVTKLENNILTLEITDIEYLREIQEMRKGNKKDHSDLNPNPPKGGSGVKSSFVHFLDAYHEAEQKQKNTYYELFGKILAKMAEDCLPTEIEIKMDELQLLALATKIKSELPSTFNVNLFKHTSNFVLSYPNGKVAFIKKEAV